MATITFTKDQNSSSQKRKKMNNGVNIDNSSNTDVLANGFQEYKHGVETITQNKVSRRIRGFFFRTVVPIFLMIATPNFVISLWFTAVKCDGSFMKFVAIFRGKSLLSGFAAMWSEVTCGSWFACGVIGGYSSYALFLMRVLPGETFPGPLTEKGNIPVYKDNGFYQYVVTVVTFIILTVVLKQFGYSPSVVYDRLDEILFTLCIFSAVFCLILYFKGLYAPSSSDSGTTGNFIFDYYWGTELYPRIFGFDVKVFTNCRFGMMVWGLLTMVYCVKSYELWGFVDSMFVSTVLQMTYICKFFWWEGGYMRTIDIMLDRAGYYICWGCLVFVPGMYASVGLYMVNHPVILGPFWFVVIILFGLTSIYINYRADMQKQEVRFANGDCLVWGKKPDIIRAQYTLEDGQTKESILLASGWWGLSRHFHYIPEIMLAFSWSVPALFTNVMPYMYVIWLLILLTHRSYRDDRKCGKKYGTFWTQYCQKVPHRIVPYLF